MSESKSKDSKTWVWVTITVAIIGCIGAVGASFIGVLPEIVKIVIPAQNAPIISVTENPASSLVTTATASSILSPATQSSIECISPQQLATQKGWAEMGWADEKYCGLRVNISTSDELPALWEAIGEKRIYQDDQDRSMSSGVWSIYPPFSCRVTLGCSQ